jgi:hypothetical protein
MQVAMQVATQAATQVAQSMCGGSTAVGATWRHSAAGRAVVVTHFRSRFLCSQFT